jgi:hypothetical protein
MTDLPVREYLFTRHRGRTNSYLLAYQGEATRSVRMYVRIHMLAMDGRLRDAEDTLLRVHLLLVVDDGVSVWVSGF